MLANHAPHFVITRFHEFLGIAGRGPADQPARSISRDRQPPASWRSPRTATGPAPPLASGEDRPGLDQSFAELNQRLDALSQQLSHVAQLSAAKARAEPRDEAPAGQWLDLIAKLDRRLDQLIDEGRSAKSEMEHRVNAVGRAIADLNREQPIPPPTLQLLSIRHCWRSRTANARLMTARRMRVANGGQSGSPRNCRGRVPRNCPARQQLRSINSKIEIIRQPCGVDKALDTLRDDLAEIGVMVQEAMPRKSVEALEREVRNLAERIDHNRGAGGDDAALASMERALAEVRDALRALTPAESLVGIDRELQQLSHKIDLLAHNSQDPAALRQLEGAIVGLRGIVSHVASNDALASLSDEVRALAGKIDGAANSSSNNVVSALEERIAALADALERRNHASRGVPHELESAIKGLVDKIERLQFTRNDHTALAHLEDRIAKLVEKLDASDARLNHLEAIERGLAELLIHLEHQRVPTLNCAESSAAEVGALSRELDNLRQTEKKTQEMIEAVHGTLGHVVDRLAMIETDMRSRPARPSDAFSSRPRQAELKPGFSASPRPAFRRSRSRPRCRRIR